MEVKAHRIAVSIAFPPDTETPGYEVESALKHPVCAKISADGAKMAAEPVARSIVRGAAAGAFRCAHCKCFVGGCSRHARAALAALCTLRMRVKQWRARRGGRNRCPQLVCLLCCSMSATWHMHVLAE